MILADRIIFIDAEAMILDKPSGLPVDRPRDGALSLENHLDSLTFGFKRWPVAVHRLDRDTSGCLLLARNPKAQKVFQQAFEAGQVEKTYLAVLEGVPTEAEGVIDLPLGKVSTRETGWRMVGDQDGKLGGKAARTRWQVVKTVGNRTLVRFQPETGRTHQIRVHALEGLGCPIVGDPVYGKPLDARKAEPMLLHAWKLRVPRPSKPAVEATAPLPPRFAAAGFEVDGDA